MVSRWPLLMLWLLVTPLAQADGPQDNLLDRVRPIPPKGITLAQTDRSELEAGVDALGQEIEALRTALEGKPRLASLLPDVQIYHNAVRYALAYDEFFKSREVSVARELLRQGRERAGQLRRKSGLEHGRRAGRARLRLEDRRLGPALWPGGAGIFPAR